MSRKTCDDKIRMAKDLDQIQTLDFGKAHFYIKALVVSLRTRIKSNLVKFLLTVVK